MRRHNTLRRKNKKQKITYQADTDSDDLDSLLEDSPPFATDDPIAENEPIVAMDEPLPSTREKQPRQ